MFEVSDEMEDEFKRCKIELCKPHRLGIFDPKLRTLLISDAAKLAGVGFVLLQVRDDGSYNLVQCGSCALRPAQVLWAICELECFSILFGVRQCEYFLKGLKHFTVLTDHQPLLGCFKKPLRDCDNARIFDMRTKLMNYNFTFSG